MQGTPMDSPESSRPVYYMVKDTGHSLPLTIQKAKRLKLVFIGGEGVVVAGKLIKDNSEEVKKNLIRLLEEKGFEVDGRLLQKRERWRNSGHAMMPVS